MAQAASIGLGVGGALVSSALGAGPAIGFLAGSTLGSVFFGPGNETTQSGPRLSDLSVSSSAYGRTIPLILGTARLGGNVIASSDKIETKQVQSAKGNPLSGPEVETFHYRVSFAMSFGLADSDAKLLKLYADKKLIYDSTDDFLNSGQISGLAGGVVSSALPRFELRWYPGGATQEVDPVLEELFGENESPAYRHLMMVVFEDFSLDEYGQRVPQIEAVISTGGAQAYPSVSGSFISGGHFSGFDTNAFIIDFKRNRFITQDAVGPSAETGWRVGDIRSMDETLQITEPEFTDGVDSETTNGYTAVGECLAIDPIDGWYFAQGPGGNGKPVWKIDPNTFRVVDRFGVSSGSTSFTSTSFSVVDNACVASALSFFGARSFLVGIRVVGGSTFGILRTDDMTFLGQHALDAGSDIRTMIPAFQVRKDAAVIYMIQDLSSNTFPLSKVTIDYNAAYGVFEDAATATSSGIEISLIENIPESEVAPNGSGECKGMWWDENDSTLIMIFADSTNDTIVKYDPDTAAVIWKTDLPNALAAPADTQDNQYVSLRSSQLSWFDSVGNVTYTVNTQTGEIIFQVTDAAAGNWMPSGPEHQYYGVEENAIYILGSPPTKIYLGRNTDNGITLQTAVETILDRSGYESDEYDMSALSGVTFPGYILSRPSAGSEFIKQLASAFFFSIVESDYVLKGVLKSSPDTLSVVQDDLGQANSPVEGSPILIDRMQEEELPVAVSLLHAEPSRDYQTNTQHIKRVSQPALFTMQGRHNMVVEMPIMLEADDARQIAEKMMYTAWIERELYEFSLSWEFLALDPSDVVTITMDDGTVYSVRVTQVDIGANMHLLVKGVANDTPSFTSTISGDSGDGFKDKSLFTIVSTELFILHTPLLRDEDDTGRSGTVFYTAAGARAAGWTGAFLYESADASSYDQIGSFINDVTWGGVFGTLAAPPDSYNLFDETTTIDVSLVTSGATLTSVTKDALLADEDVNAALIGDEVIRFQTATDNGDGTYTLSGLLRGRRGTDWACPFHTSGENFVLLEPSKILKVSKSISTLLASRFLKAISVGQSISDVFPTSTTIEGADLKPYAPGNIVADYDTSDPDIVVSWTRRTRVNAEFTDGPDPAPLNEDSEAYEAYILSSAYDPDVFDSSDSSTYVRAFTGLTSETFTYTEAQQSADGFDRLHDTLYVVAFQVSAQVGNGWPGTAEITHPDSQFFVQTTETEDDPGTWGLDTTTTYYQQYTVSATGKIFRAGVYLETAVTGNIRVGVYDDSSDLPVNLLAQESVSTDSGDDTGWRYVEFSSPPDVSAGDKIWIAWQSDTNRPADASTNVNSKKVNESAGYSSGLSNPAGSTSSTNFTRAFSFTLEIGA